MVEGENALSIRSSRHRQNTTIRKYHKSSKMLIKEKLRVNGITQAARPTRYVKQQEETLNAARSGISANEDTTQLIRDGKHKSINCHDLPQQTLSTNRKKKKKKKKDRTGDANVYLGGMRT